MAEEKKPGYRKIPIGGLIIDAGGAEKYETGDWRTYRPICDRGKCIDCLQCWLLCPDMSIVVKDGKMVGYDYGHCKGCGICAKICPVSAITMVPDAEEHPETDERGIYGEKKEKGK